MKQIKIPEMKDVVVEIEINQEVEKNTRKLTTELVNQKTDELIAK